jgi:hypothetical protein
VVPIGAKTEGKKHEYLTNLVHCSITVHQCGFGQGEEVDDVNLLDGPLWSNIIFTAQYHNQRIGQSNQSAKYSLVDLRGWIRLLSIIQV